MTYDGVSPIKDFASSWRSVGWKMLSNHGSLSIFKSDFGTEVFDINGITLLSFRANSIFIDAL